MFYYILFFISIGIFFLGEFIYRNYTRLFGMIFFLVAIALVSYVSGIRNYTVGVDISVYGNTYFTYFSSLPSLKSVLLDPNNPTEIGYAVLNWLVSRFTDDPHVLYISVSFLTTFIFFRAILMYKNFISLTFGYTIYLFLIWYLSINILRQSIAISFVFLAFTYLFFGKNIKFFLFFLVAFLFHSSAILSLIFAVIYLYIKKYGKFDKLEAIQFSSILSISLLLISNLLLVMTKFLGFLNARYYVYAMNSNFDFRAFFIYFLLYFGPILLLIPIIIVNDINKMNILFFILMFISATFSSMQAINYIVFGRFSYYFLFTYVIGIPSIIKNEKNNIVKLFFSVILLCWLLFVFYYNVIVSGYGDVHPYSSYLLDYFLQNIF